MPDRYAHARPPPSGEHLPCGRFVLRPHDHVRGTGQRHVPRAPLFDEDERLDPHGCKSTRCYAGRRLIREGCYGDTLARWHAKGSPKLPSRSQPPPHGCSGVTRRHVAGSAHLATAAGLPVAQPHVARHRHAIRQPQRHARVGPDSRSLRRRTRPNQRQRALACHHSSPVTPLTIRPPRGSIPRGVAGEVPGPFAADSDLSPPKSWIVSPRRAMPNPGIVKGRHILVAAACRSSLVCR
jgi:hypothetical protein